MRIFLGKFKLFAFILLAFYGKVNAQTYTITGNVNSSTLACSTFTGYNIINIGNGSASSLIMNNNLNLTTCSLAPIQLFVNTNANIDFSINNSDLRLPAGSSITFNGGTLYTGSVSACSASDRIWIGGELIATCEGKPGVMSFEQLVAQGGYNLVNINPTSASACGSGIFSLTATAIPSATATAVRWYSVSSGGTPLQTTLGSSSTYTTPTITSTTTFYAEATIGASTTPRKAVLVTINSLPTAPTIGTITQPTCPVATGSVVLSGLPAGNWTLTRSGTSSATTTGTGTSTTISGLAVGTYAFTVSNGTCTSAVSTSVLITSPNKTWNGSVSTDWNNAANWTPTGVPTSANCVTIPNVPRPSIISGTNFDAFANTLTLQTLGSLTVNSSNTITVTDFVNVWLGFLTFEDDASLVQINNVTTNNNSGDIVYKRLTSARPTDYTYWSSPVSPMTLGELYPAGSTFYSYEATSSGEDWSPFGSGTDMVAGKGYIANRGAAIPLPGPPPPPDLLDATFTGVPNNGHYEINGIFANKSYLLGNPYPSALDAETFLNDNAGVLNGTLYFWTHTTQIGIGVSNPGTGVYAYSGNDYATYNATGGVAATQRDIDLATGLPYPNPGGGGTAPSGSVVPTGKIGSGQGFFASTKTTLSAGSKIVFDNTMRVGVNGITGNNSQFFKKRNAKTEKTFEKNRIWLNFSNTQGAFKQTLVGYVTNATNEYDDRFDGESFDGNEFVDFYSVNQEKNLVIQGRGLPFDENDEVPLGYRTTIKGAFSINIDQADGLLANQAVFIEDKLTNTLTDLKSGNYTFNTVAGTFNDRFVLRYKNNSTAKTLAAAKFDALENTVLVSSKNKQIKINSFAETIEKVTIYDLQGRQIYQKEKVNSSEFSIANLVSSRQVLVVKTVLQNGVTVTDKIIY